MQIDTDNEIVTVFIGTFFFSNWKSKTTGVLCFLTKLFVRIASVEGYTVYIYLYIQKCVTFIDTCMHFPIYLYKYMYTAYIIVFIYIIIFVKIFVITVILRGNQIKFIKQSNTNLKTLFKIV